MLQYIQLVSLQLMMLNCGLSILKNWLLKLLEQRLSKSYRNKIEEAFIFNDCLFYLKKIE